MITRPMLAASLLPSDVEHSDEQIYKAMCGLKKWPVLASLKMDGIRGLKTDDLVSRTFKMIPNESVRRRAMKLPCGFDMELFQHNLTYDEVESIVMSEKHEDSDVIDFHILDDFNIDLGYGARLENISHRLDQALQWTDVKFNYPELCLNADELMAFFLKCEKENGEGICFRTPNSPYKQGRSTLIEQYLIKLARFTRTEATIYGFEEQMMNLNKEKRNAVGRMDRSKTIAGQMGKGTLGAFLVKDDTIHCPYCPLSLPHLDCTFCKGTGFMAYKVGTGVGLTDRRRQEIWDNRDNYFGSKIVVKTKKHGTKVKPRSPIYCGFRDPIDL